MRENLEYTSYTKMTLMILVIFGHSIAFWSGDWFTKNPIYQSQVLNIMYIWLNSFHTFAFTLVSGYIFAFKIRSGSYNSYKHFLLNKAKRLLVPYVFVAILWVIPISILTMGIGWEDIIWRYVLCTNPSQLWFLWMLFDIFVIIWPLWSLINTNKIIGWVTALLMFFIGIIGNILLPNFFCIWIACQYFPFFFIGIRIRVKEEEKDELIIDRIKTTYWLILDFFLFIAFILSNKVIGTPGSFLSISVGFFLHIVGAITAFIVVGRIAKLMQWEKSEVSNYLAKKTMPMYLFHQQIIYFMILWLNGKVNPYINSGCNFLAGVIGSLLISVIIMHWKTTRILVGE